MRMSKSVLIKLARRIGVLCVLGVAAGSAAMASAQAQEYPNKPIRVIVPYGAGQATDLMCRVFLEQLKTVLKQSIVIENRPGAATNIGAAFVAKAPPDGYTLLCTGNATSVANPLLYENMGFDPDKDLTPITAVAATGFLLLAGSEYKDRSLQDLIAKARTSPQPLLVGLASTTATVIYGMVQEAARIPLSRVPYTGGNTRALPGPHARRDESGYRGDAIRDGADAGAERDPPRRHASDEIQASAECPDFPRGRT
jgi:tripartite-type tricarboxylate transporter receptor subunit TctC